MADLEQEIKTIYWTTLSRLKALNYSLGHQQEMLTTLSATEWPAKLYRTKCDSANNLDLSF